MTNVSGTNTKAEILKAYETLVAELRVKDIAIKAIEKSGIMSMPVERRRDDKAND